MHFCMKDGKDMKKTVKELADKVKTEGADADTIAKEAESVMNNQVSLILNPPININYYKDCSTGSKEYFMHIRRSLL